MFIVNDTWRKFTDWTPVLIDMPLSEIESILRDNVWTHIKGNIWWDRRRRKVTVEEVTNIQDYPDMTPITDHDELDAIFSKR